MSAGCFAALMCEHVEVSSLSSRLDVSVRDATDAFDHILIGAPDVDLGIRWIEERTGVRAMFGGNHPGAGTRDAPAFPRHRALSGNHRSRPCASQRARHTRAKRPFVARIIQWAIHTENIAAAKRMVETGGIKTVGPQPGSRQRPDGKLLRWQTLGIEQTTPLVPFFIQWEAGSPHPSSDSPRLGTTKSLRFETPQPDELRRILHAYAVQAEIRQIEHAAHRAGGSNS